MVKILDDITKCTGCSACMNVCPYEAIQMEYSKDGFLYPQIKEELCIKCNLCRKTCPVGNKKLRNEEPKGWFAVWANDEIRKNSSSGGVFTVLAQKVLDDGGTVYGAAFNAKNEVMHIGISSNEEMSRLQGSKYVQSQLNYTYKKVEDDLENDKYVLFSGCPCQVAGLYSYLTKDYEKLITIDLICFGVPSPKLLKQYIDENFPGEDITNIRFRTKKYGWIPWVITVQFKDGHEKDIWRKDNLYSEAFFQAASLRQCCENCEFAEYPRFADITLGDFWDIEKYDKSLNDNQGTSVVVLNNEKGEKLFNEQKSEFKLVREVEKEVLSPARNRITKKVYISENRDRFVELCNKYSIEKSASYALNRKWDIAIVGNWSHPNYGATLTYYALYKTLQAMDKETVMIERPMEAEWKPTQSPIIFRENPYNPYDLYKIYNTKDAMVEANDLCDTFVFGSDQMWTADNYYNFGKFCFMDYIYNYKNKISYATSFGYDEYSGDEKDINRASYLLKKIDSISVREKSGTIICKEKFNVDAECVLDPVFLCDKQVYLDLADKSEYPTEEKDYIATYILDASKEKENALRTLSASKNLLMVNIGEAILTDERRNAWGLPYEEDIMIEDWIKIFRDSKYIVTDSYHGMCVALLLKKKFVVIANKKRGMTRFSSLTSILKEDNFVVTDPADIVEFNFTIDYDAIYNNLKKEILRSRNWLLDALLKTKNYIYDDMDYVNERLLDNSKIVNSHSNRITTLEFMSTEQEKRINWQEKMINGHEGRINWQEEMINGQEKRINWQEEMINGQEKRVNWQEEMINAQEKRINWQEEMINAQEKRINWQEEMIKAQEKQINLQGECIAELKRQVSEITTSKKKKHRKEKDIKIS